MSNEQNVKQKEQVVARSTDEILTELKSDHSKLLQKIITAIKDNESLKNDPKHLDSFNMTTMQIQAMNLYSYFLAIRIRMLELEKSVEEKNRVQVEKEKENKNESNIK